MPALRSVKDVLKTNGEGFFNKKQFEEDINYVLNIIDKIESETNLKSADMLEALGGKAARFAGTYTKPRITPAKFKSRKPNKLFRRKVISQTKRTESDIKGVWYERVGSDKSKKRKGKKRSKPNQKLKEFNKKTAGKRRGDKTAPFFSPAPIPKANQRGLRKTKLVVYLRGNRRRGVFGVLPVNMDKGWNQRILKKRNPGAGVMGWKRAIGKMKVIDAKDKPHTLKRNPTDQHKSTRRKVTIGRKNPSMRTGANLSIVNRVKYANTSNVDAITGARKGTRSAINWFMGRYVKEELKKRYNKYNRIYKRVTS